MNKEKCCLQVSTACLAPSPCHSLSLKGTLLEWLLVLLPCLLPSAQETGKSVWSEPQLHLFRGQPNRLKLF